MSLHAKACLQCLKCFVLHRCALNFGTEAWSLNMDVHGGIYLTAHHLLSLRSTLICFLMWKSLLSESEWGERIWQLQLACQYIRWRGSACICTHQTVSFTVGSGCQKDEATAGLISSLCTDNINRSASQTSHYDWYQMLSTSTLFFNVGGFYKKWRTAHSTYAFLC